MVQIVQQRAQAYQLQDLKCRRCRQVRNTRKHEPEGSVLLGFSGSYRSMAAHTCTSASVQPGIVQC